MTRYSLNGVIGEIDSLPGCSQIAVSHSVFIPGWQKLPTRGQGTLANAMRKELAFTELGYDCMICTADAANEAQIAVLSKNLWTCLTSFKSSKTGHEVQIWCCKKRGG